jgi:hypothetical protein
MMQSAAVLVKSVAYDAARIGIVSYTESGTTRGVMLPIGGELLQRQYGELYPGEFEFYARRRNAGLLPGNQLRIGGVDYDITAIRDYVKVVVCLLRKAL